MVGEATGRAEALRENGFVVFEDVLAPERVAYLRREILDVVERLEPPTLYAPETKELGENAAVTTVGLAIRRLLREREDLLPFYVLPPVRAFLGEVLGEDLRLEDAGAMVSDTARPFFSWHTHIDGEDEGARARAGRWPKVDGVHRVLTLLYLDDVDDDAGPLHVLPRRVGEPTEPPHELDQVDWPGQVKVRPRAGTLVAFEQCTWHAALPRQRDGHRVIAGAYFASASAPPAAWADETLASWARG